MLTSVEIADLVNELRRDRKLRFTDIENMRAVRKAAKQARLEVFSRTAHGSQLDPRYTVEGRNNPDRGLGNSYDQFHPKLYILEV